MCGIVGFIYLDGQEPEKALLETITNQIEHRGPDGDGYAIVNNLALGHRRLSIIDLTSGAQPMYSHDKAYIVCFNGEIFNYLEIKAECQARGSTFKTDSDTEVIIEAFRLFGVQSFSKLNGQFAFALYDLKAHLLYLVRDRMGEKPLYFSYIPGGVIFASELKAIFAYKQEKNIPSRIYHPALLQFLSLNYVPFDDTLVQGVRGVRPGTFLQIGKVIEEKCYWDGNVNIVKRSSKQATSELLSLLEDATKLRLRSDVPVGLFLSGGIDSTAIGLALSRIKCNPKAFIAHFPEAGFSEAGYAAMTCQHLGIPSEVVPINFSGENLGELVEELVYHGDEPLADSSSVPVYLLSRATSKQLKVVLSGDGGDELFGGYLTYKATRLLNYIPNWARTIISATLPLIRLVPTGEAKVGFLEKLERFVRNAGLPPGAAHFAWNGMFSSAEKLKLLHPNFLSGKAITDTFQELASRLNVSLEKPSLKQLMHADQENYLCHDILHKADRMSMAHGLEVRPVFMDYRLVEFSRSLELSHQFSGFEGRKIVRDLLRVHAPWYQLDRPKQGFSIPIHLWFRTKLKEFAGDLFHSEYTRNSGLYSQEYLLKLWKLHQKRKRNLGFELWGVMVSLLWARRFNVAA